MSTTLMDTSNVEIVPRITPSAYKGKGKAVERVDLATPLSTAIPQQVFLLSIPSLLQLPPDHQNYIQSLCASLDAIRKCQELNGASGGGGGGLSFDQECRMHGMLAELGLRALDLQKGATERAELEREVDQAIAQGSRLCQRFSSLQHYKRQFTLLRAHLLLTQSQIKACRATLKGELSTLNVNDSPSTHYTFHLTYLSALLASKSPDTSGALNLLDRLQSLAQSRNDPHVAALALALRLRFAMSADLWYLVGETCEAAEKALGLSFEPNQALSTSSCGPEPPISIPSETPTAGPSAQPLEDTPLILSLKVQVLLLSVVYHTHINLSKAGAIRLSALHNLLDSDALSTFPDGVVEVELSSGGPPLALHTTHPRILYELALLVSSVSKRDVVGRKPKKKIFANEGVVMSQDLEKIISFSLGASLNDVREVEQRLGRVRADLLSEMVSIGIMRSEFDEAASYMSDLIAHTRTAMIFEDYASRITLMQGHFAHAVGKSAEALECYRIAAFLAGKESASNVTAFVRLAARVGEVTLRIGLKKGEAKPGELEVLTKEVIQECREMGEDAEGSLTAYGRIFEATTATEITETKKLLKSALEIVTQSCDNHLRALILALLSNLYLLTAGDHAQKMLDMCKQLAAGLGAPPRHAGAERAAVVGNAPLGLWVGERFLELHNRAKLYDKAKRQEGVNRMLRSAIEKTLARPPLFLNLGACVDVQAGSTSGPGKSARRGDDPMKMDLDDEDAANSDHAMDTGE